MLAAQQQYTFPQSQDSRNKGNAVGESITPISGNAAGGLWQDEQETFLRNLLESTPLDHNTSSITSGASHYSQSPPYLQQATSISSGDEAARNSSLSPVSSSGYHSLHDFIHRPTGGQLSMSASSNGGQVTPTDVEAPHPQMSMPMKNHNPTVDALNYQQGPSPLDAGTIDFFVNMMTNDPNAVNHAMYPMMQQNGHNHQGSSQPPQLNLALLQEQQLHQIAAQHQHNQQQLHHHHHQGHPMYGQPVHSFAPQDHQFQFQNPMMGRASLPFSAHQHQQPQQSMQSLPPALDSRKRSAPTPSETPFEVSNNAQAEASSKRARKPSTGAGLASQNGNSSQQVLGGPASSFMPHMEVGSNATALAAIERLKAKKLAAAELESKARANKTEANGKAARQSFGGSTSFGGPQTHKQEKKVAHNAIERRYRNNINARIAALRNTVPALRELRPKKPTRKGKEAPPEDLVDGVPAATKLNKATILGKATEYIRYLKGRETRLVSEVAGLRELIRSLEGGEELLDLWQGEMERVVAEQEALAKAQLAALDDDSFDMGDEDDDDDEEDEDIDVKPSHSPSTNASSSSRYMMGIFMGFSVLGGGAEIIGGEHATNASPTEHAHSVLRASSGRVIGASHQLLKRGMQATNVNLGRLADDPHHYDHVANHLLVVEVLRGLALLACLTFIFWPWITRLSYFNKGGRKNRQPNEAEANSEEELDYLFNRKEMLATLNNPHSSPHQADGAMRRFVGAPQGAFLSVFSLTALVLREMAAQAGLISRRRRRSAHEDEKLAIWCRLLELETSLGPLAQRSLLARLHTILAVASSPSIGFSTKSTVPILNPSRVFGTLAIALSRASNGITFFHPIAERYWVKARRCRLLALDRVTKDLGASPSDRWLDPILEMDLLNAASLCPAPTHVANTFAPHVEAVVRASMTAPLVSIATTQHNRHLAMVWTTLLRQIVQMTCPTSTDEGGEAEDKTAALTCSEFVKHYSEAHMKLPILADAVRCERLTSHITELTMTAPHAPQVQVLCSVTLAAWALLTDNSTVARSVAFALVRASQQGSISMPASGVELVSLVLGKEEAEAMTGRAAYKSAPQHEVDSLAAAALAWIGFLRLLSQQLNADVKVQNVSQIASSAISVRRLLAAARSVRPIASDDLLADLTTSMSSIDRLAGHRDSLASVASSQLSVTSSEEAATVVVTASRIAQNNLDDSLDTLTDILTVLGRRAAMGDRFTKETLLKSDDQPDSGVEWSVSTAT